MNIKEQARFNQVYQSYRNELTLQGKSPKIIDMYSRCIRQVSVFFDSCPNTLTTAQLKAYFLSLVQTKSWSAVKIARNAIQFFYRQGLNQPWDWIPIVKPPAVRPLQDVLSQPEVVAIIRHTRKLRYQTYYWVTHRHQSLLFPGGKAPHLREGKPLVMDKVAA